MAGAMAGAASLSSPAISAKKLGTNDRSVMNLTVPKMKRVRCGVIGFGQRGGSMLPLLLSIDGVDVTAVCDVYPPAAEAAAKLVKEKAGKSPAIFSGADHDYKKMMDRDDVDIVFIFTPWSWHVPMALDVMNAGKHAFVEVPAAYTVEDCWRLVETSEKTQRNCMMLENVCYGQNEMMVLNMVRAGVFGDLTHGEGAYIHELRWQMKEIERGTGSWRTYWHARRNANIYPTHGLGPIAQYMGINRGDRFDYMTSMSSNALGRSAYAKREFPAEHERNTLKYIAGDINSSLIKTVRGRSILIQHDTTTPRPYSRINHIQGTNGAFSGYPNRIALENNPLTPEVENGFHKWDADMAKWHERFDHEIWKKMGTEALENKGHGGMDFVMLWRIIYCLRNGLPLDQNVYDAAAWSAITPLSEQSVTQRSNAQDFPDFTRGTWKNAEPVTIEMV